MMMNIMIPETLKEAEEVNKLLTKMRQEEKENQLKLEWKRTLSASICDAVEEIGRPNIIRILREIIKETSESH